MYTTDIRSIFIILIRLCSLFGLSVGDEKCTEFNKTDQHSGGSITDKSLLKQLCFNFT